MQLGWIDFSKSERSKILSVLDLLTEAGTLDELGIAPIRDGFANIFFPGTSTIQTRAKYFFIIPYSDLLWTLVMRKYVQRSYGEFTVKEGFKLREYLIQDVCELHKLSGMLTNQRIPESC